MNQTSKKLAGILLIILPTVAFGGASLLTMLIDPDSGYMDNKLRQDLWRAGHAHAGIMLIFSLIILKYVDEAALSDTLKNLVRIGAPATSILMPAGFFLSVLDKNATEPNGLINLTYAGFVVIILTFLILGIGLLRKGNANQRNIESSD